MSFRTVCARINTSRWLALPIAAALLSGCGDGEDGDPDPGRPKPVINEQKTHTTAYKDDSTTVDAVAHFRTTKELPELDVRRLFASGADVYAGGVTALMKLTASKETFETIALPAAGVIVDLAGFDDGRLAVAQANRVHVLTKADAVETTFAAPAASIQSAATRASQLYVGTPAGLFTLDASGTSAVASAQGFSVVDMAVTGDVVWMATNAGLQRYDAAKDQLLPALKAPSILPDDDVRSLAVDSAGAKLIAATSGGVALIEPDGSAAELRIPEIGGLPTGDLLAVAERDGVLVTGHLIGASAMTGSQVDHYHTQRWIPDEAVNDVAVGENGERWVATAKGISRIYFETQTLAERAAVHELKNANHDRMDGFVPVSARWPDEWDRSTPATHSDHDNDGLWSQMQVAAWCFAYATTGEESYYKSARRTTDVMLLQFDVPEVTFTEAGFAPGFITRSLVRSDEGEIFDNKKTQDNWHLQEFLGKTYYWKDDTSSDEYDGHFFGIPIFYDLCAKTEEEREAIRVRVDKAMSYIVDNDYDLIDLDGKRTLHGKWSDLASAVDGINECVAAAKPNCFESFGGGGWLNSIEVLGMLLASWHITGNSRYYDEYERLAIQERYAEMIPIRESYVTVTTKGSGNHSDHELASLAYYTLLRYEPNPARREVWIQSIRDFYDYEKVERNALEIAVMSSAIPDSNAADAAKTLLEIPFDWREWQFDNSHRKDNELDVEDRHGSPQWKHFYPYDEINTINWNANMFRVVDGSSGKVEQAPWPFLLPYWMMRYYGAIE